MSGPTIEQRVAAGVAKLDEAKPGWPSRIDLDLLALDCGGDCILGQAFGDYYNAPWSAGPDDVKAWRTAEHANASMGFQAFVTADVIERDGYLGREAILARDEDYRALEAEWRRVITARREASNG